MTKYDSVKNQVEALEALSAFNIDKEKANVRYEDPLENVKLEASRMVSADNITVVAKKMVVDGDINSSSPISVKGTVNGDITTTSDIGVNGLVCGNLKADNINFNQAAVKGNAEAAREVSLGENCVLIGDINGQQILIGGKVKGNVNAKSSVRFQSKALMVGTVNTCNISMDDGARVSATINLVNNCDIIDDSEFNLEV